MTELLFQLLIIILVILLFPFLIFVIRCITFLRIQPRLLFLPHRPLDVDSTDHDIHFEPVTYQSSDGKKISALYVPSDENPTKKVILFCHGNVGNIHQRIDTFIVFKGLGFDTFTFDYRGYGESEGKPGERGLYRDADGAWNYLTKVRNIEPSNIIVFGRSLGGSVAAYLGEKFDPFALVIESSFTSIPDMARRLFRWRPAKLLTRYKFNTRQRLKKVHCPVLIIHSPDDFFIPYQHGQILYETANPPKKFLEISGNHYQGYIKSGQIYTDGIKHFLQELVQPCSEADTSRGK